MAVLEAAAASLGNEPGATLEAAVVAEHAVQLTPAHDDIAHAELVAVVAGCKGRALLQVGDLTGAAAALAEGIQAAQDPRLAGVLSELMGLEALVEAMSGHLQRASGLASRLLPHVVADATPTPQCRSRERRPWRWHGCASTNTTCLPPRPSSVSARAPPRRSTQRFC